MIKSGLEFIIQGLSLPRQKINLGNATESKQVLHLFNSRHPKLPIFRRKTIGVELINLKDFAGFDDYVTQHSGKNSAVYFRRRCQKKNYTCLTFEPDNYKEEINAINTSLTERQGKKMQEDYVRPKDSYKEVGEWDYLGVFSPENKLVAYLFLHNVGELTYVGPVLGHGDYLKEGVMYLLFTEAVDFLIKKNKTQYFMYDMFFGGSPGLRMFKSRIGFKPFRVKWMAK